MNELDILKKLYLRTEQDIINELARLRSRGLIDYHAVAALGRIQRILTKMVGRAGGYVRRTIERYFYRNRPELYTKVERTAAEHLAGYIRAEALSATEQDIIQRLTNTIEYKLAEAALNVQDGLTGVLLGRQAQDLFRTAGLAMVMRQQAQGTRLKLEEDFVEALQRQGITAFVDKAGRKWSLHNYADMVTRTTARQAEVLSVVTRDPGQDLYKMSSHYGACKLCAPYQGRVYSRSGTSPYYPPLASAFGKIDPAGPDTLANSYMNIHPNCLVPGGTILAEGIMAHSSRDYHGRVVRLITTGGDEITVTPNHPILTTKGFIAAGLLNEGDKIVKASGEYGRLMGEAPNNINVPTAIEDIPHSLVETCKCSARSVIGSTIDFHGDGVADGKVDIVFVDGFVKGECVSILSEPFIEDAFPSAHSRRLAFLADSVPDEVCMGALHSTNDIVSGCGLISRVEGVSVDLEELSDIALRSSGCLGDLSEGHSLLMKRKHFGEFGSVCFNKLRGDIVESFGSFGRSHSVVDECNKDGVNWYAEMCSHLSAGESLELERLQSLFGDNGLVVDGLAHIDSFMYSGKVYNLQTECGFYAYNTIITHNCLHSLTPWSEEGKSPQEVAAARKFSSPVTNPFTRDPRSEAEIEAYRRKEEGRRKWLEAFKQWEKYREWDIGPKTFNTFLKHKIADDEKYHTWLAAYRNRNE